MKGEILLALAGGVAVAAAAVLGIASAASTQSPFEEVEQLQRDGNWAGALSLLDEIETVARLHGGEASQGDELRALMLRAESLSHTEFIAGNVGRVREAVDAWSAVVLAARPRSTPLISALTALAKLHEKVLSDFEGAEYYVERLVSQLVPKSPEALRARLWLVKLRLQGDNLDQARTDAVPLLESSQHLSASIKREAMVLLGSALVARFRCTEAEPLLKEAGKRKDHEKENEGRDLALAQVAADELERCRKWMSRDGDVNASPLPKVFFPGQE